MSDIAGRFDPSYSATTAPITLTLIGDTTVIAAPAAGNRIVLWHFDFLTSGIVSILLKSGATSISGTYPFPSGSGFEFDAQSAGGPIRLGIAEAFVINLSAGVGVNGLVRYSIVAGAGN